MAKLFIPACGDRITLIQPWQFNLYLEYRNIAYAKTVGLVQPDQRWSVYQPNTRRIVVVPHAVDAGTVLECDRVYIRSTAKLAKTEEDNYDSITWKIVINGKQARNKRFWVKLSDCHTLEFDPGSISKYQDRK